jgi:VanZ family protein
MSTGNITLRITQSILWILVISWMAAIFMFSSQPAPTSNAQSGRIIRIGAELMVPGFRERPHADQEVFIERWQHVVRKSAHGVAFFSLGILCSLAALRHNWSRPNQIRTALAIPYGYAVFDEIHQLFVSGRAFMFTDIGIDMAAATVGVLMIFLIASHRGKIPAR